MEEQQNKKENLKVLINLATLKKGGGQNVGLNFLYSLKECEAKDIEFSFLAAEDTEIHNYLVKNNMSITSTMPNNPLARILKEIFVVSKKIRKSDIKIVYTYFGFGFFVSRKPQLIGSADSNLYYPEIDFWHHYSGIKRLKKWLIDKYRVLGLRLSSAVLFENKALELRGRKLFCLKNTRFIKPSVNFKMESKPLPFKIERSDCFVGLFLCGWQLNKNVMLIPYLAKEMKARGIKFRFILTAPNDNSENNTHFQSLLKEFEVEDMIQLVGNIKKQHLAELYNQVDFIFLLSKLESFSNNIIESWHFKRLLIVADEEWSRAICKDAAIYVDRDSVEDITDKVSTLIENKELLNKILLNGQRELGLYPTIVEKTEQELRYIRDVAEYN